MHYIILKKRNFGKTYELSNRSLKKQLCKAEIKNMNHGLLHLT